MIMTKTITKEIIEEKLRNKSNNTKIPLILKKYNNYNKNEGLKQFISNSKNKNEQKHYFSLSNGFPISKEIGMDFIGNKNIKNKYLSKENSIKIIKNSGYEDFDQKNKYNNVKKEYNKRNNLSQIIEKEKEKEILNKIK